MNLIRFPYVAYNNGGGTFIVPYVTCLLLVGMPVYFNELALGQFAGMTPIKIFGRIAPGFQGLGYVERSFAWFGPYIGEK